MPIGFLTPGERERLSRFPEHIPDDDLFVFFRLSDDDHGVINQQREDATRLGFALQLCALRYLGFARNDLSLTPWEAVVYVARSPDASAPTHGAPTTSSHSGGLRPPSPPASHRRRRRTV